VDPQLSGIKECTSGDWLLLRDKACKDEWFIAKYDGEEGTASDKLYVGPDGETTYYWGPVPWDSRRCPMDGPENESNRTIRCDYETITNGKQNNSHGILVENFQDELYGYISSIEFILYSGMVEILVPLHLKIHVINVGYRDARNFDRKKPLYSGHTGRRLLPRSTSRRDKRKPKMT
jgi:hypothetical protein